MFAGNDMSPNALDDDKRQDKRDYKKYACINHYMQEVAVVFRRLVVSGEMVLFAHL